MDNESLAESPLVEPLPRRPKAAFLNPTEPAPDTLLFRVPRRRPKMSDIRKLSSIAPENRPVVPISIPVSEAKPVQKKVSIGWFIGVFVPTLVNLLCFTFYVEVPTTIKKVGLGYGLIYLTVFELIAYGTLTSLCAIATNGEMKDGGVYYLISRTLGRDLGAASGIILIVSHCTAVSSRLSYLCHAIADMYGPKTFTGSLDNDIITMEAIFSVTIFLFGFVGEKRMLYSLLVIMILVSAGVVAISVGIFAKPRDDVVVGFSSKTFKNNWYNSSLVMPSLHEIGDLLSSTNGIMTVADFGGNLDPPQKSIPIGGFSALVVSSVLFVFASFLVAGCVDFSKVNNALHTTLSIVSISPIVSKLGFIGACYSSALTMCFGGARIIKAMTDDGLLPKIVASLRFQNESFTSLLIVLVISICFSFIKDPIALLAVTNVSFLIPLALANAAVFACASAHYPGFRPTFKFFNKWVALFLMLFCIARAISINWFIALIFIVIFCVFYCIYEYIIPKHDEWGSVLSSQVFYSTMEKALKLYRVQPHVKTYRSNILLVTTKKPEEARPILDFLNQMLHRHGMLCFGRLIISDEMPKIKNLIKEREGTFLKDDDGYRTFYDVLVAPSYKNGVSDMIQLVGIGEMKPNTLCLEFPEGWQDTDYIDFVECLYTAFKANYSVTILRNTELIPCMDKNSYIDVWCNVDDGGLSFLLPYLLSTQKQWRNAKLRIMTIAYLDEGDTYEKNQETMKHLLYLFRIDAEVVTLEVQLSEEIPSDLVYNNWLHITRSSEEGDVDQMTLRYLIVADLIRQYSIGSSLIAFTMFYPHEINDLFIYMSWLDVISSIRVPFLFIRGNGQSSISFEV